MATAFNLLSPRPASFHIAEMIDTLQSCVTDAQLRAWLSSTHDFRARLPELLLSRVERERRARERVVEAAERPNRIREQRDLALRAIQRRRGGDHRPALLAEIEAALVRHGIRSAQFGREAVGDPMLIPDIRGGRSLRDSTAQRVRGYIARLDAEGGC